MRSALATAVVVGALTLSSAYASAEAPAASAAVNAATAAGSRAGLGREQPAPQVRSVAEWVARSRDNGTAPYLIVDKRHARLFVFDAQGHMTANAPVLLGLAKGDDTVPGIGERKIADIKSHERTTPAGRFVAEGGRNLRNEDVVWIDYDAAVSMHRVLTTNPRERRAERLATPTFEDNRISYGCINVPVAFFNDHVSPIFRDDKQAIVYVLPDVKSLHAVFRGYDGEDFSAGKVRHASAQQSTRAGNPR